MLYLTICANCAEKLAERYLVEPVPGAAPKFGSCRLCFQPVQLLQYGFEKPRMRARRRRTGGGERERAGR